MIVLKIYINGYFLTQKTAGVQRFATQLLQHLDEILLLDKSINADVICLVPYPVAIKLKAIRLQIIKSNINFIDNKQTLWEQLVLPVCVKRKLLLNFCNFAPLFKKNQMVVIHDVIPFRYPKSCSFFVGTIFRLSVRIFVARVKQIATVSKFSAKEILDVTHSHREILVLGNSGEHIDTVVQDDSIIRQHNLPVRGYLLTLSSQAHVQHKNFIKLYAVAKKIKLPIVAIGGGETNNGVEFLGAVTDSQLKSLYANAFAFIFPSTYEGFGIPPLEAMWCKVPVIVSDISVFREIYSDAVLYFNSDDVADICKRINELQCNNVLYNDLITKGYARTQKYNWCNIAHKLLVFLKSN